VELIRRASDASLWSPTQISPSTQIRPLVFDGLAP
jgi:hypothetical protein